MSVTSMTGFARWEGTSGDAVLQWEARAVNGKGLDIRLRMPPSFEPLEGDLKRLAAAHLSRGNVQAALQIRRADVHAALNVNRPMLEGVLALSRELVEGGHASLPTADGIIALRGVLEGGDNAAPDPALLEHERAAALAGFAELLERLNAARSEEGSAIGRVLERRVDEIEALVERAEADPARRPETIRERLRGQVEELLGTGVAIDPQRLAQEAAILATRADVREELDRLRAHVASARQLLQGGAVGRRLDFLAQEFNRESNTMCAKSNAATLTAIGLDLKVVVDQFREQVQNVE